MHLTSFRSRKTIRALAKASAAALISVALLAPAAAQFWNPFGGPRPPQRVPQQQQQYNPFGGFFGAGPERRPQTQPKADYSSAPPAARRTPESSAAITSPILVLGDAMAEWLAYGLEDAFSERPEFGVVRKHRTYAGLVRYDTRRDVEWPQIVREAIAADKPKFIVMMVGFHDRQSIRERGPATPSRGPTQTSPQDDLEYQDPDSPESRAKASAAQQNAEMEKAKQAAKAAPAAATPEQKKAQAPAGPMEFQSEAWQAAYVQRIDATIAALKAANVPVFWVGLPPQRDARQSAAAVYLNELFRTRAERAGIVYVDIWDGFVDEAGRYVLQGPDFEGQIRRLRSGDGLYFTRPGARKLAHYVEREILRSLVARQTPVALPAPEPAVLQSGRPGAARPLAGPVVPLTASIGGGNELLGGGPARPTGNDPLATRVLVRGEPVTAPTGRADNFAWPRSGVATIREGEPEDLQTPSQQPAPLQQPAPQQQQPAPQRPVARPPAQQQQPAQQPQAPAATAAPRPKAQQQQTQQPPGEAKQPAPQRKAPPAPPRASNDNVPRPPLNIAR